MEGDSRASGRKFPPVFFIRDLPQAKHFAVEIAHLIHPAGEQNYSRHSHGEHLGFDVKDFNSASLTKRGDPLKLSTAEALESQWATSWALPRFISRLRAVAVMARVNGLVDSKLNLHLHIHWDAMTIFLPWAEPPLANRPDCRLIQAWIERSLNMQL